MRYADESSKRVDSRPLNVLNEAFQRVQAIGTSTACIVSVHQDTLHAANLGDSGFLVLRKGVDDQSGWQALYKSQEQAHFFNCPFQLGTGSKDSPADADLLSLELSENDLVLVGTDGFFDNMFMDDVLEIVDSVTGETEETEESGTAGLEERDTGSNIDVSVIADALLAQTLKMATSRDRQSPFSIYANDFGYAYSGGKLDDITLIVAHAIKKE